MLILFVLSCGIKIYQKETNLFSNVFSLIRFELLQLRMDDPFENKDRERELESLVSPIKVKTRHTERSEEGTKRLLFEDSILSPFSE